MKILQLVERFDQALSAGGRAPAGCEVNLAGGFNGVRLRRKLTASGPVPSAVGCKPIADSELYGLTEEEVRIVEGGRE